MKSFPVYVISLRDEEKSVTRRENLVKQFTPYANNFIWVDAVDAREMHASEYYYRLLESVYEYNFLLTHGEICCTLSHIKALRKFLETDEDYAIIMEDDVIGSARELEKLFAIFPQLGNMAFLSAYCSPNSKVIGKQTSWEGVYYIIPSVYPYAVGSICYVVTRASAQIMLRTYNRKICLADEWHKLFFRTNIQYFLVPCIKHPIIDEKQSLLSIERKKKPLLRKHCIYGKYPKWLIWFWKIKRKIFLLLTCRLFNICGFTRLLPFNRINEYERIRKKKEL